MEACMATSIYENIFLCDHYTYKCAFALHSRVNYVIVITIEMNLRFHCLFIFFTVFQLLKIFERFEHVRSLESFEILKDDIMFS